jgi:hypothetical protein
MTTRKLIDVAIAFVAPSWRSRQRPNGLPGVTLSVDGLATA